MQNFFFHSFKFHNIFIPKNIVTIDFPFLYLFIFSILPNNFYDVFCFCPPTSWSRKHYCPPRTRMGNSSNSRRSRVLRPSSNANKHFTKWDGKSSFEGKMLWHKYVCQVLLEPRISVGSLTSAKPLDNNAQYLFLHCIVFDFAESACRKSAAKSHLLF